MFSFENLHRNHKLAFLDGFLCGVLALIGVAYFVQETTERTRVEDPVKIPNQRKATPSS